MFIPQAPGLLPKASAPSQFREVPAKPLQRLTFIYRGGRGIRWRAKKHASNTVSGESNSLNERVGAAVEPDLQISRPCDIHFTRALLEWRCRGARDPTPPGATMSNTPNRASNPAGKPRKKDTLDLTTARQMLPLVQSIVSRHRVPRQAINQLSPEQERLERHRRDLVWLERQRRYQVADEIAAAEKA